MAAKAAVYVPDQPFSGLTKKTFLFHGGDKYKIVTNLKDCDIAVLTGGEDIWPGLYHEKPIPGVYFNKNRDKAEIGVIEESIGGKKFMVGICRGAQLLNVIPNGGSLFQDVDGHGCTHRTFDCVTGTWKETNSVHHQMMRLADGAEVVAWAMESTRKEAFDFTWVRPKAVNPSDPPLEKDKDIEAAWYPNTKSFLVQFHPEFGHPPTTRYFMDLMDKYYFGL